MLFLLYLIDISLLVGAFNNDSITLEYIHIVVRHGSRAPVITYPNDPYPRSDARFWPFGPDSLSKVGRQQMYQVGSLLRERYNSFLGREYQKSSCTIGYNDLPRLFESAACVAAGLFPPYDGEIWKSELLWQPVTLQVIPFEIAKLAVAGGECEAFANESLKQLNILDEQSPNHKELLDQVSLGTGDNVTKLSQIHYIYSTLLYDVDSGYKLPQWAKTLYPEKLRPFYTSQLIAKFALSELQIKLGAGPILKNIGEQMRGVMTGSSPKKKLGIETTHDSTIISLLRAMGNTNPNEEILLGAYIIYELHKEHNGYVVKVFYTREYDSEPHELHVPGCPFHCTWDKFMEFVGDINFANWTAACNSQN